MTDTRTGWIDTDLNGLAKTIKRRGPGFIIGELLRNSLDEDVTRVEIKLRPTEGRRQCYTLCVTDDSPTGFRNLSDAYTLFAESYKKTHPEKAGRFNVAEKFVLALCEEATITSTTGRVTFNGNGRTLGRTKRQAGTQFVGIIRMTREEYAEVARFVDTLLIPEDVVVTFNGDGLSPRNCTTRFRASLPTEVSDEQGVLRRVKQATTVECYEPLAGEVSTLYELGIPIMELGDRWHVNVLQKIPLTLERDAAPPSYLRTLRTLVLNQTQDFLSAEDVKAPWVHEAAGSPEATPDAVEQVMNLRFGARRVSYDPSDPEANKLATASGYTVVPGGSLSAGEWENVRRHETILPAGRVTPSPKPFSLGGKPLKMLPFEKWTDGIKWFGIYVRRLAETLIGQHIGVDFADDSDWPFNAVYGRDEKRLTVNAAHLGLEWFRQNNLETIHALFIHELAHDQCSDHLSADYYRTLCCLGARLTRLALENPELVRG